VQSPPKWKRKLGLARFGLKSHHKTKDNRFSWNKSFYSQFNNEQSFTSLADETAIGRGLLRARH
jgi:hypothetical protein